MKSVSTKSPLFIVLIFTFVCFITPNKTLAQQTIINVPSADVLPKDSCIFKTSVKNQINENGYTRISPTTTVGIGHGMDLSFAVPVRIEQDYNTTVNGDIGLKKVLFLGNSTRFTVGGNIAPSFNDSITPSTFTYAHLTKKVKKTKTSLTAGAYLQGDSKILNSGGILVGVEQVIISNKLRLAFDWFSGDNSKGNYAVGLKYRPSQTLSITGATVIPNRNDESIAFQVSMSKYFTFDLGSLRKKKDSL